MNKLFFLSARKVISLLIFLLCFYNLTNAQTEADAIVFGWCHFQGPFVCDSPNTGNTIVYFNDNGIDIITPRILNMPSRGAATYRDENVFYTNNGWVLMNGRGEVIVEKMLSPEFQAYNTYNYRACPTYNTGLTLSVNFDNTKRIFLFYGEPLNGVLPFTDKYAAYTELNPYNMDTSEALITTGNILLKDADSTIAGNFSACRHANGRDWWVLKPSWISNKFYKGILGPDGIELEPFFTDVDPIANNNTVFTSGFSLKGDKYFTFRVNSYQILTVYDFDRCTGSLSNPVIVNMDSLFADQTLSTVCFSPDASKIYFSKDQFYNPLTGFTIPQGLYQYDIASDSMYYIRDYNAYGGLMVSPNGKWILIAGAAEDTTSASGFRLYLSAIYEPNKPGLECNLQENQFELDNVFVFETPQNWGNYRLGPIDGSVCDSLGLDAPIDTGLETLLKEQVKVFPNPTNGIFNIALQNKAPRSFRLFDMLGKEVSITTTNAKEAQINLHDLNAKNGIYFLEINNYATKQRTSFKVLYEEQ